MLYYFFQKIIIFYKVNKINYINYKGEIMGKQIITIKDIVKHRGVFFIAEVGVNHDGKLQKAMSYVDEAANAGINAIKFQAFTKDSLFAEKEYCKALKLDKNALTNLDDIVFKQSWYKIISPRTLEKQVIFMTSVFSPESVVETEAINMQIYKIASCDINNVPLLKAVANTKKPVILSLGLATKREVKKALTILKDNEVALLHCIVEYPTEMENLKLNRILALKEQFPENIIGFSDHSIGTLAARTAITLGAQIIEKHFTIEPNRKDGDHIISSSPADFKSLVIDTPLIKASLGTESDKRGDKKFSEKEKTEFVYAKRGIYLKHAMKNGSVIKESDIVALRPCTGMSVSKWSSVIGKKLTEDKKALHPLQECDIIKNTKSK